MAFRRQDIRKTTRRGEEGQPRRLYPQFFRDRSMLPRIDLAIDYLEGMAGQRRGDMSPDAVLDLFGDPKMARCILACMAETYRYRTPAFADVVGPEATAVLDRSGVRTAGDLRDVVYRAVNARRGGFVVDEDRGPILRELAAEIGVEGGDLERLLHLDAERNAVLARHGPRPRSADVMARYNVMLTLSVLRHAATVTLQLPGLSFDTVSAICAPYDLPIRADGREGVILSGRPVSTGGSFHHGAKLARCALHLILLAPRPPSGEATIDLNSQRTLFLLDAKVMAMLRPRRRLVADFAGMRETAAFLDDVATERKSAAIDTGGWTVRRALEPIVVEDAIVLPEALFVRGQTTVALCGPDYVPGARGAEAIERLAGVRHVILVGKDAPALGSVDGSSLFDSLNQIHEKAGPETADPVGEELLRTGWITVEQVAALTNNRFAAPPLLDRFTIGRNTVAVSGFGLIRRALLETFARHYLEGPVDVAELRRRVAELVGEGSAADALTLHLLSERQLAPAVERAEAA